MPTSRNKTAVLFEKRTKNFSFSDFADYFEEFCDRNKSFLLLFFKKEALVFLCSDGLSRLGPA
jgi:hypothetical protein